MRKTIFVKVGVINAGHINAELGFRPRPRRLRARDTEAWLREASYAEGLMRSAGRCLEDAEAAGVDRVVFILKPKVTP